MPLPTVELKDVSMTDQILRRRQMNGPDGKGEQQERQDPLPEELMSSLDPYSGDGRGRVTVSAELGSNIEFGFGAKAFVGMSVTCDSNLEAMRAVHDILRPVVKQLVEEDHADMSDMRDSILPSSASGSALNLGSGQAAPEPVQPAAPTPAPKPPARTRSPKFQR